MNGILLAILWFAFVTTTLQSKMSGLTETNRQHFEYVRYNVREKKVLTYISEQSANYDSKHERVAQIVKKALEERKDWIEVRWAKDNDLHFGRETRLLDYACGTGSITKIMGPWVTTIRGIDISENMVQKYNEAARSSDIPPERVNAVVGDLFAEEVPEHLKAEEYYNFDLAVIGLGFHHFENPVLAVQRIAERLRPGTGTLLIIDFLPFDDEQQNSEDPWTGTIKTRGFARANIEKLYKLAKLEKFSFSLVDEPAVMETKEGETKKRSIFIARGRKEATTWGKISNWMYGVQMQAADQFSMVPRDDMPDELNLFGGKTK